MEILISTAPIYTSILLIATYIPPYHRNDKALEFITNFLENTAYDHILLIGDLLSGVKFDWPRNTMVTNCFCYRPKIPRADGMKCKKGTFWDSYRSENLEKPVKVKHGGRSQDPCN